MDQASTRPPRVGIKLALLAAREVVTESLRGRSHAASRWHLASREFAPYEPIAPPGFITGHGTAVLLHLNHGLSPLLDPGFLEHVLRQHYQPMLDQEFAAALAPLYPRGVRFEINGRILEPRRDRSAEHASLAVRTGRQRKPSGLGHIERHALPLSEALRGIAISTYGKVIRRGWDWLGILPAAPDRISGIVEIPALAQALTLNKGDFIRTGPRGALYLAYRSAIQEAVQAQLTLWGDARDPGQDERRRVTRPLERDLERVLEGLRDDFPLLASLVEPRRGRQQRITLGDDAGFGAGSPVATASRMVADVDSATATAESDAAESVDSLARPDVESEPAPQNDSAADPGANGSESLGERQARAVRHGLTLQFEPRPADPELARLIEHTVWVNTEHPAYRRAESTHALAYHVAVSVALALAPLASGGGGVQSFLTAFLAQWGEAVSTRPTRSRVR
jgi:hypothetical protein